MNPWESVLATYLQQQGATNPRIVQQQPHGPNEVLFTVEADSWTVPSQFGADKERMFTVWADGSGTANVGEVGLMPR